MLHIRQFLGAVELASQGEGEGLTGDTKVPDQGVESLARR